MDHVDRIRELLQTVRVAANNADIEYPVRHRKQAKRWDVVAWKRGAIRIVQFKQDGEDFKESQRRFALGSGFSLTRPEGLRRCLWCDYLSSFHRWDWRLTPVPTSGDLAFDDLTNVSRRRRGLRT